MGTLRIRDLKIRARIGASARERRKEQHLLINIVLEYDSGRACASDELHDALDYRSVSKKVAGVIRRSKCFLLERLTSDLVNEISGDRRIHHAFVRVEKIQVAVDAAGVSFEMVKDSPVA